MYAFLRARLGDRWGRVAAIAWYSVVMIAMYVLSVGRDSPFIYLTF